MSVETKAASSILAEKHKPRIKGPTFVFGGKMLSVIINKKDRIAATKISIIANIEQIPGATTELYRQAFKAIKQAATILGEPIEHTISTKNPKMKAWAKHPEKGMAIFQWRPEDISEENGRLTAKKIIYPEQA